MSSNRILIVDPFNPFSFWVSPSAMGHFTFEPLDAATPQYLRIEKPGRMLCNVILWVTNRADAVRVMTEARFFKAECDIAYNASIKEQTWEDNNTRLNRKAREKHWNQILDKMEADDFDLTVISPNRVFKTAWSSNDTI